VFGSLIGLFIVVMLSNVDITFGHVNLKDYLFGNTDYSWTPNITHFPFILFGKIAFVINTVMLKSIDYLFFM
jgi:hypothetical protein